MKTNNFLLKTIAFAVFIGLSNLSNGQTFCNPKGNVMIFSNYDGGILRINIDQNIPNIKIGIVSYEDDSVIISGAYAANVTKVIYAGYSNSSNKHCTPDIHVKGVYGVSPSIVTIIFSPKATLKNAMGNANIVCSYVCSGGNGQGCNAPDQIVDYFNTVFKTENSNVYFYRSQYGCWTTTADPLKTYKISEGGTCCILSPNTSTGLENISISETSLIQPNPSDGHIKLSGNLSYQHIKVYDTMGAVLFSKNKTEYNTNEIDLSMLPKGVYFIEALGDFKKYTTKMIIQ